MRTHLTGTPKKIPPILGNHHMARSFGDLGMLSVAVANVEGLYVVPWGYAQKTCKLEDLGFRMLVV